MNTFQQTLSVTNQRIVIDLPEGFKAQEVEVVRPTNSYDLEERRNEMVEHLLTWDVTDFSGEKLKAYQRLIVYYRNEFHPHVPPPEGLWSEFVWIADDFDAPMEDEDLWYADNIEPEL